MKRSFLQTGLLLAATCMLSGCDNAGSTGPGKPTPQTIPIAFIGAADDDAVWQVLRGSAKNYPALSSRLEVRLIAPSDREHRTQDDILKQLIDEDVRAVCIQVRDDQARLPTAERLYARGIPMISVLHPLPEQIQFAHAGMDNAGMGAKLAELTAKALPDPSSIMVLHAGREHPVYGPRLAEFEREIRHTPRIEVFAYVDCAADPLRAHQELQARSERFPRLTAWVMLGDWALRRPGMLDLIPPSCKLLLCDASPTVFPLLRSGRCPAVVTADYAELAQGALQLCESALGEPSRFVPRYKAPVRIVTPESVDTYAREWAALAAPQSRPG